MPKFWDTYVPTDDELAVPARPRHRRGCRYLVSRTTRVIRVVDDPTDHDRVIVTDMRGNRASMTVISYQMTCVLAPGAEVDTLRIFPA